MSAAGVSRTEQHSLTLVPGLTEQQAEARLLRVVWAAPRDENDRVQGPPGLHDLSGTQRTALVNDLSRFGIDVEIRVRDLDLLRRVTGDATATALRLRGPSAASTVASQARMQQYDITTAWQPFPVTFANWLDYERSLQRTLGASHTVRRREKELGDGGEVAYVWRNHPVAPVDLFEFRMAGDTMPRAARDVPQQELAREWQRANESENLRAEMAELRRMMAQLSGTQPDEAATKGEVIDDTQELYTPDGGAFLVADAVPTFAADDDDDAGGDVSPAELDRALALTGGGVVKGGKRR